MTVIESLVANIRSRLPDPVRAWSLRRTILPLAFLLLACGCTIGFRDPLVSEVDWQLRPDLEGHWLITADNEPGIALIKSIEDNRYRFTVLDDEIQTTEFTVSRVGGRLYASFDFRFLKLFDTATGQVANPEGRPATLDFVWIFRLRPTADPDEWQLFMMEWDEIEGDLKSGKLVATEDSRCDWELPVASAEARLAEDPHGLNRLCVIVFEGPEAQRRYIDENWKRLFPEDNRIVMRRIVD